MNAVETMDFGDLDFSCDGYARVLFTQELAEETIKRDIPDNRGDKRKQDEYVRDMRNGKWLVGTGETIKFTKNGVMIDGHQRISSVIKSGVPVYIDVKCGVPLKAFKVVDSGAVRTDGDVLKMLKVKNCNSVAAMAKKALTLRNGANAMGTHVGVGVCPTRQEVTAFALRNNDIFQSLHKYVVRMSKELSIRGMGTTGWFVAYWLTHEMNSVKADEFFESILNGEKFTAQTRASLCAPNEVGRSQGREWVVFKYIDAFNTLMMDGDIIIARNGSEYAKAYKSLFIQYLEHMRTHDKMFQWKPNKA